MLKKLFGGTNMPLNNGDTKPLMKVDSGHWVKVYELVLSNMEGSPSYPLTHQLSIGSEIGNVVIADPSISPRHCTFILQQEVISVLDHGSISGTFVNGTKITPGKYIILEDTDIVVLGDLEIRIKTKMAEGTKEIIPEIPSDKTAIMAKSDFEEKRKEAHIDTILAADAKHEPPPVSKKSVASSPKSKTKGKNGHKAKSFSISSGSKNATNSIIRVFAVTADFLLSYSLFVVFNPFNEFRGFLEFIPTFINDLIGIDWKSIWATLTENYGFLSGVAEGTMELFSNTFHFGPILLIFILLRLISTLVLGVSISEKLLGVKADGNGIWKRIGGVIRVLVGVVTGPFLLFDIPSIISRRTFKEVITLTHTFIASKFFAIVGVIVVLPLFIAIALFAPLLQGLESPEPILVNDTIEQRVKVSPPPAAETTPDQVALQDSSQFYHLELSYSPADVSVIPLFKFRGSKAKTQYQNQMAFYHKDLQRTVTLEVFKTFDFKQLMGIGMRGNIFLFNKFPQIYDFVYTPSVIHPSIKGADNGRAMAMFANEFMSFTKLSFGLDINNALEFMQNETPLLKGFVEYRASLLALLEYKDFHQIGFIKIGNVTFMKVSYLKQKPFDLIIPLIKGDGRIYKVEFDKRENLAALANKFYKYTLVDSNWLPEKKAEQGEAMTPMQALDTFSQLNFKRKEIAPEKAQALYGYYFEKSSQVLVHVNPAEYLIWKESIQDAFEIMKALSEGDSAIPLAEGIEDPRIKLFQNFKDLKDAVEAMDKTYFGLDQNPSI